MIVRRDGEPTPEFLLARLMGMDEKFRLALDEARNASNQRFEASEKAVKTAMDAAEKAVNAAMAAAEKAVQKAEVASEKRLDGVNELRLMALDWKGEFARQTTVDLKVEGINEKIATVTEFIAAVDKRTSTIEQSSTSRVQGRSDVWGWIAGAVGFAYALVMTVLAFKQGIVGN